MQNFNFYSCMDIKVGFQNEFILIHYAIFKLLPTYY